MQRGLGDFDPQDVVECPEDCPHCPESRCSEDCLAMECIYYEDPETAADKEYHAMVDECERQICGKRKRTD